MRYSILFLVFFLAGVSTTSNAQFIGKELQWYIGPHVGLMNYYGELSPSSIPSRDYVNAAGGIQTYVQFRRLFGLQFMYSLGRLNGNDSLVGGSKVNRGYDFVSTVHDFSLNGKLNMFFWQKHKKNFGQWMWQPKLVGGIGYFRYNPRTQYNGAWIELQEIGTEGQHLRGSADGTEYGDPYSLWALNYRVGGEISIEVGGKTRGKARYKRRATVDFFFYYVRTFTDYIDDVGGGQYIKPVDFAFSDQPETLKALAYPRVVDEEDYRELDYTRGNPDTKDGWFHYGFAISYQLDARGRRRGGFGPRRRF